MIAIRANVIDGTGSPCVPDRLLHVHDGRIDEITGDDGREVALDLSPFTVVPGLVDAHVHLCCDPDSDRALDPDEPAEAVHARACANAAALLSVGVTAAADCGGPTDVLLALREELLRGEVAGPRLVVSGRVLTRAGEHGVELGARVVCDGADVGLAVAELAGAGVDFVKVMGTGGGGDGAATVLFDADALGRIVDESRRRGLPVAVHAHGAGGIANAIAAGADRIEHCTFFDGEICAFDVALAREVAASGALVCPTNAIDYRRIESGRAGAPREALVEVWRGLRSCGVELVGGSDAGVADMHFDDYALVPELMVSELGVTPLEALVACTSRAAAAIGLGDELGTLKPGKRADLVAVDGDPSEDPGALRRVVAVVQDGRVVWEPTPVTGGALR